MSEPFIGSIIMFGGNFAPKNWAFCNGQLLPIAQNTALFSILGTTFGGNGQTTFGLPNMQSRVPVHPGQGAGLSAYTLGEMTGTESVTITQNQMPAHGHPFNILANEADPNSKVPLNTFFSGNTGGSQPFSQLQPYLTLNFQIALEGIFPSRN